MNKCSPQTASPMTIGVREERTTRCTVGVRKRVCKYCGYVLVASCTQKVPC